MISVISLLHSIENWHFSPANFLNEAFSNISYGGKLILAFTNNSNLKKDYSLFWAKLNGQNLTIGLIRIILKAMLEN